MKKLSDIIMAHDPERYFIRYNKYTKARRIITLQIENDYCYLTDSPDNKSNKSRCFVYFEGLIEDFCIENKAIENGMLFPDVALLNWYNKNMLIS